MIWRLALLFTIGPAIELYLLVTLGGMIGPLPTVLIVILTGVVGAWLAKREGLAVLWALNDDLERGLPPATRVVEAVLILVGGVLLITPGFLSDLTGILLLVPPVRRFLAPRVLAYLARRFELEAVRVGPPPAVEPELRTPASERHGTPFDHPVR